MTILVPTDFSKNSKVAVLYAAQLAKKTDSELLIVNVVYGQASSRAMMVSPKLEAEMKRIANQELEELKSEIKAKVKGKLKISSYVFTGFPVTLVIQKFIKKNKVDLIIMGTHGATGVQKVLVGTNAAAMIQDSPVPVIIVPRDATFHGFKKVAYATDMENVNEELSTVCQFVKPFNGSINVLHVVPEDVKSDIDPKQTKTNLIAKMKYDKITFHIAENNNVAEALDNFMIDKKVDILVMFTHKLTFFEKLFSRSVTRKIAFHSHLPMLTFNKDNLKLVK